MFLKQQQSGNQSVKIKGVHPKISKMKILETNSFSPKIAFAQLYK